MVRILWRNGANNLSLTYLLFDFCGFVSPFAFSPASCSSMGSCVMKCSGAGPCCFGFHVGRLNA